MKTSYFGGGGGGGGGAPTGPAGGDLSGTYPNPTVIAAEETSGPTRLTWGSIPSQSLVSRVGTALVAASLSAGLSFGGGQLTLSPVSGTAQGAVPQINVASAVLISNAGATAAVWTAVSGGGTPVGSSRNINTTGPLAGGGNLSSDLTLSVAAVSNTSSGVAPQHAGAADVGKALIATSTGSTWGTNFGAQTLITTGDLSVGTTPALTGVIRIPNTSEIRGRGALTAADFALVSIDNQDNVTLGGTTTGSVARCGAATSFRVIVGANERFNVQTFINMLVDLLSFSTTSTNPVLKQNDDVSNVTTGDTFTTNSQDCSGTTTVVAGARVDRAGDATGASGTRTGGAYLSRSGIGATANGVYSIQVGATVVATFAADTTSVAIGNSTGGQVQLTSAGGSLRTNNVSKASWASGTFQFGSTVTTLNCQSTADFEIQMNGASLLGFDINGTVRNLSLFSNGSQNFQSGDRTVFFTDRTAAPTGNPTGGHFQWSETGGLPSWRNVAGDVIVWTLTSAATATAGGGALTPASVSEFMTVTYKGNVRKVALYAN